MSLRYHFRVLNDVFGIEKNIITDYSFSMYKQYKE